VDTIKIDSGKTKMIAHRGLSGIERENTCSAFVAAANRRYFGIETDVRKTKDSQFVIIHDENTDRVSLGEYNINVEETHFSVLENIILPDMDGTVIRKDIRIPTLEEYIQICKKYDKICVLELKNFFAEDDIKTITDIIKKHGYIKKTIFISFKLENCLATRQILPDSEVQWLIHKDEVDDKLIKTLVDNKLDIDIYYKRLTKENIKLFHSHGIKVNCWTCDSREDAQRLVEYGVDFITTNILE